MKKYIERISNITHQSFAKEGTDIELQFQLEDISLEMSKSIPLGLLINEILINAHKHAFEGQNKGYIHLKSEVRDNRVNISIADNGIGLPEEKANPRNGSLGMTLINKFSKQLKGDLTIDSEKNRGTKFTLVFNN
jgi:two-component sensor histidine kinase